MGSEVVPTPIAELIEAGDLIINDGYRVKKSELSSMGTPFARAQNVNDGFHLDGADCFPEEDISKIGIKISQPGDVVFTSKGTVGRFAFVREDTPRFVYSPQLCFWRSLNHAKLHPRWLYYWMQSREFFVQYSRVADQTDMAQYVSLRDQRRMCITIPPLNEQRAIAHILGMLDDKIELNRQMNRTLEAMAQALFKSWFIDFDPVVVNALRAGNPIPDKFAERAAHYQKLLTGPSPLGRGVGVREKKKKLPQDLLDFARNLRKNQTDAEQFLWQLLRGRRFLGLKFRRQHPVKPYVLDFYCHELKLAVEVDGGQHNEDEQRRKDEQRTAFLARQGITVARYWADIVLKDQTTVLQDLYEQIQRLRAPQVVSPSPLTPLPEGEGNLPFPEDTLRQFPDRFQDSELGPIPEGWEVKPIGDLVKCVGGATPSTKKPEFWEGGTNPFLTPKDMASLDSPVVLGTERHITDAGVEKISSKKLPIGTVLLSSRAPIGYLAINEVPVSVNQGIIAMICDGPLPNHYVFFWAKNNMDVIKGKAGGTTFAEISKKNFRPIPALLPSEKVLDAFANMARLLYLQLYENTVSCATLAKLRDTLLPKLISGELRVPDAEKLLEGL
ncbi:DUF559 domain-containing protein [Thiolapillus sp.]